MPCTYWEDTDKKDEGRAFLDKGSMPPVLGEDGGTYKTSSK
jgi:hypothetical protein